MARSHDVDAGALTAGAISPGGIGPGSRKRLRRARREAARSTVGSSLGAYEVRCPACNVSFPPEARRCLHCGGRTVRPGETGSPLRGLTFGPAGADSADGPFVPLSEAERALPPMPETDAEIEGGGRRTSLRFVTGLVWLLLALFMALTRNCGSG